MDFKSYMMRGVRWLTTGVIVMVAIAYIFPEGIAWLLGLVNARLAAKQPAKTA